FKRRLTLIAAGRGGELDAEIQLQLAQSPPSGDWLLLAMATAAQKDDFKTAAKYLERASQIMSQDALAERVRDFYLYQWCFEKEMERFSRPWQPRLSKRGSNEPPAAAAKPGEDGPASASPAPDKP